MTVISVKTFTKKNENIKSRGTILKYTNDNSNYGTRYSLETPTACWKLQKYKTCYNNKSKKGLVECDYTNER